MLPTDRSIPPVMITSAMPAAITAKKLVFFASSSRLSARMNLFAVPPPGAGTVPPKNASSAAMKMITATRPISWKWNARRIAAPNPGHKRREDQSGTSGEGVRATPVDAHSKREKMVGATGFEPATT